MPNTLIIAGVTGAVASVRAMPGRLIRYAPPSRVRATRSHGWRVRLLSMLVLAIAATPLHGSTAQEAPALSARVIAVGIGGASAVSPVGSFHPGGPIRDKPEFAAFTQPGRILDARRVLVASSSNYGAPRALGDAAEGSVLSIDPEGPTIVVPARFATAGNQASAQDGRVQLFTAQSPAFVNGIHTPGAASASHPAVSNPLGISINNAFGRPWFANAPNGMEGMGTDTIVDPNGQPLAGAPSKLAGGVFAGGLTNRPQQVVPGALQTGAIANSFVGMSPDGSKRAVFVVLTADGALVQAHAEHAVDGLAPAGTIRPIALASGAAAEQARVTRAGMIFNWVPDRILFITDPGRNAVVALTLTSDDKVFRVRDDRTFTPAELDVPIDLAPVVPEVANPGFSSNTTMAGNADMYVANRGNGTIVRMRQDGTVVAVRRIALPGGEILGAGRLNGIAVSPDAQTIWVTVSGVLPEHRDGSGALIEVPAFGPGRAAAREEPTRMASAQSGGMKAIGLVARGETLFQRDYTPEQGLGPLYNGRSCLECHHSPGPGGMGLNGLGLVQRVGRLDGHGFDPLTGHGGPVARGHSVAQLGIACAVPTGPPAAANVISLRNASPLFGLGSIDAIPDAVIAAGAVARGAVHGRPNIVIDAQGRERVGRFGWKADVAMLEQFVAEAFRNELGITSPLAPVDLVPAVAAGGTATAAMWKDDGTSVRAVTAYLQSLPAPATRADDPQHGDPMLFSAIGCAACHTPALTHAGTVVPLYSDLLLHDMGPALDDGVEQVWARGKDWRTTPLWGLSLRARFLHDGRALTIRDAILAHDGEAVASVKAFRRLSAQDQNALLAFLSTL